MSFDAILAALSGGASRAQKTSILASADDQLTGIINNDPSHYVAKSYFESQGPSGTTGTALATLVDILEVLSGDQVGTGIDINGMLKITGDAVAVGMATVADRFCCAPTALFYDTTHYYDAMTIHGSDLSMLDAGNIVMYPDGAGNGIINLGRDGGIRAKEGYVGAILDDPFTLLEYYRGGVYMRQPWDEDQYLPSPGRPLGPMWSFWRDGAEDRGVDSLSNVPVLVSSHLANLYVGRMAATDASGGLVNMSAGPFQQLNVIADAPTNGAWLNLLNKEPVTETWANGISFCQGWAGDGANPTTGTTDLWQILHQGIAAERYFGVSYESEHLAESWALRFNVDDAGQEAWADFAAMKVDASNYYRTHLRVLSNLATTDFYLDMCPQWPHYDARTNEPGLDHPIPALLMSNGDPASHVRIGCDSWHESAALRLSWESKAGATTPRGVIAIGDPAGTHLAPVDPFVLIPETQSIGINIDNLFVAGLYNGGAGVMTKTGLWVGYGSSASSGAKIFLQDQANGRAGILMGTTTEQFWAFLKNGVSVVEELGVDADDLGESGAMGRFEIPGDMTLEDLTTGSGRTDARTELNSVWNFADAKCTIGFKADTSDVGCLMVEIDTDGAGTKKVFYFTPDGNFTP